MSASAHLRELMKPENAGTVVGFLAGGALTVYAINWWTGRTRKKTPVAESEGRSLRSDSSIDCHRGKRMADVDQVLRSAHKSGLLGLETQAVALFYDLDALKETLLALRVAFPPHFLHCIAVKANPLPFFLRGAVEMGFGLETASMGEVMMALQVGCKPDHIVFDSPAKGRRDIAFALKHGLQINADNFDELVRIDEEQQRIKGARGRFSDSAIGVRLNPLVGVGKIKALSVSGADSKFGIPFTAANRTKLLAAFGTYPWLTALHCHVGSQGCSLEQHAEGARTLHEFACHIRTEYGQMRIKSLDIGGGLPVNFADDSVAPSFAEYSAVLRTRVPALFEANKMYRVITEYGRSLSAKPGWVAAVVEYVKHVDDEKDIVTVQCGSDLFMRSCYCPGDFPTRITAHDGPTGEALVGVKGLEGAGEGRERREIVADVVGPLCFQGDKLKSANSMPQVREGDVIVVHDAGANTLSLWNRHCSRLAPPVYGYYRPGSSSSQEVLGKLEVLVLKPAEKVKDMLRFWAP